MPDRLIVTNLTAACRLGVTAAERAQPQDIGVDLELAIDAAKAALRDDVREAVDYAELAASVKQLIEHKPYGLLETLAEDVASLVLQHFDTPQVTVRVRKRALAGIDFAAVEVTRDARR